jgi:hypothetical protein
MEASESQIVALIEGEVPPISPAQFAALQAARQKVGKPLTDRQARRVLSEISVHGGDDGHH